MAEFKFAATLDESCRILQSILDRGDLYAVEEDVSDPQDEEHITQITEGMRAGWSKRRVHPALPLRFLLQLSSPLRRLKTKSYVEALVAGPSIGIHQQREARVSIKWPVLSSPRPSIEFLGQRSF
jgi:hypothetical protein